MDFYCYCGMKLEEDIDYAFKPCNACLDDARKDGYNEGYEKGIESAQEDQYNSGFDAGYALRKDEEDEDES